MPFSVLLGFIPVVLHQNLVETLKFVNVVLKHQLKMALVIVNRQWIGLHLRRSLVKGAPGSDEDTR